MGGTALHIHNIVTERCDSEQYMLYYNQIKQDLKHLFVNINHARFLREKQTHGDIDILCQLPKDFNNDFNSLIKQIENIYKFGNIFYFNDSVLSFAYKNVQVDLIMIEHDNFEISNFFYSYNDLATFIGRIYRSINKNFRVGSEGFSINIPNNNRKDSLLVSNNYKDILSFIKLDHKEFENGFNNIEEVFYYVLKSPYFSSVFITERENVSHASFVRDIKRKNYVRFIEYLKENNIVRKNEFKLELNQTDLSLLDSHFNTNIKKRYFNLLSYNNKRAESYRRIDYHKLKQIVDIKDSDVKNFKDYLFNKYEFQLLEFDNIDEIILKNFKEFETKNSH